MYIRNHVTTMDTVRNIEKLIVLLAVLYSIGCKDITVELRDGFSSSSGRIVLTIGVESGTLCDVFGYDHIDATVICNALNYSLGFPVANSFFGEGTEKLLVDDLGCYLGEPIDKCKPVTYGRCVPLSIAGAICSDDWAADVTVDLVNGTENSGKVELVFGDSRVDICQDYWNNADAKAVCRMLNYSYGLGLLYEFERENLQTSLTDGFECIGTEMHILECRPRYWAITKCNSPHAAAVICLQNITDGLTMELLGSNSSNKGVVYLRNKYFNATLYLHQMGGYSAYFICKLLGFRAGIGFRDLYFQNIAGEYELLAYQYCLGHEQTPLECNRVTLRRSVQGSAGAAVLCMEEFPNETEVVTVLNGSRPYEMAGRLMMHFNGELDVYVCDDQFDRKAAIVVCNVLGYSYGIPFGGKNFGENITPEKSFLHAFTCHYGGDTLEECLQSARQTHVTRISCQGFASVICHNGSYVPGNDDIMPHFFCQYYCDRKTTVNTC